MFKRPFSFLLFLHSHFIEIVAAIFEVAHATVGVQFVQKIQIDVRDKNHFGVRSSLGSASVCRECEITGGKNSRLGILNIHVVYFGQVAYATGYDYEAFVLDGTGMCADSYTGIGVLGIGEEQSRQSQIRRTVPKSGRVRKTLKKLEKSA